VVNIRCVLLGETLETTSAQQLDRESNVYSYPNNVPSTRTTPSKCKPMDLSGRPSPGPARKVLVVWEDNDGD